jgi:hypothetical protein
VSPVKYKLGFYIPEDGMNHNHHCENLKSYIVLKVCVSVISHQLTNTVDSLVFTGIFSNNLKISVEPLHKNGDKTSKL